MNVKLNIQNLTDELAENYSINKKDAETFVKEFFSVIEEGLEKDKYVKIKGFGTFKLIEVDSRESINVNTGERFEIQGHTKVTFTPDNSIKEVVNKPFSAFQTVVLEEGVTIDAPEENLTDALSDELPYDDTIIQDGNNTAIKDGLEKESAAKPPKSEAVALEENETLIETSVAEGAADVQILQIFDDEAIKKKDQPVSHQQEVMALKLTEEKRKEISKKAENSSTPYMMFLAVLTIMFCIGIVAYIYYPDFVKKDNTPLPPSSSQINSLKQSDVAKEETPIEDMSSEIITSIDEELSQQSNKKEVTEPVIVREESVPKVDTTSEPASNQSPTLITTQPQASSVPKTASKPETTVSTPKPSSTTTTFKIGNTEYVVNGVIEEHVLQKGETLFALSRKYYNANSKYIFIVEYNKDVIKDPDNVPVGTKLKIPRVVKK